MAKLIKVTAYIIDANEEYEKDHIKKYFHLDDPIVDNENIEVSPSFEFEEDDYINQPDCSFENMDDFWNSLVR